MGENGEFCEICGKWCAESYEWAYVTYKGGRVKACHDCQRAIKLKNST